MLTPIRSWSQTRWRQASAPKKRFWARLYRLLGRNHFSLVGTGNTLLAADALLLNMRFDVLGNHNQISIGPDCRISNTLIRVRGDRHQISLGVGCTYQGGKIWVEDHDTRLTIGDHTTVVEAEIAVTEPGSSITIGSECMFAHGIEIRCGDSHSILEAASGERINYAKDIHIGRHVWVASKAMILKGVSIGDDSVIASCAVVTKSFPSNSLIGGFPANVLKENISWKRERIYRKDT
jgi:acetyltransferase-like isoleucine patch superfamily enzyme